MTEKIFQVYAAVLGWYDGDTMYAVLDLGNYIFRAGGMEVKIIDGRPFVTLETVRHRAAAIAVPELKQPGGIEARDFARRIAPPGIYPCHTFKASDTFGRPLIDLILVDGSRFSDVMIRSGQARYYERRS